MGRNRAWRSVHKDGEVDEGYTVYPADPERARNVSRLRGKAICALATEGIVLIQEASWPVAHPIRHPYMNREGAQIRVNDDVMEDGIGNDVVECHSVLGQLSDDNALLKGGHLYNVHVRFPVRKGEWKPPALGWHVERGAGFGLHSTCLLHLTTVAAGGGGIAVVVGSHRFVRRVFSWWIPQVVKESFVFHLILGYLVSFAARLGAYEIREVVASEGEVVQMNPFLVHCPSRNGIGNEASLTCQIKVFSRVPKKNQVLSS